MKPKHVTDMLWSFPERFLSVSHLFGRVVRRDVVGMTPEQIRASLDGLARLYPGHFNVAFERTTLQGVPCAKLYPRHRARGNAGQDAPVLVLAHGGGFAFGSALTHRAFASALVVELQCEVWIPEYRLAPEHPFRHLGRYHHGLERPFVQIEALWILGDSAGGNLALAAGMEWMNRTGEGIQGIGLFSPWLDLGSNSASNRMNQADHSPFERLDLVEYAAHYLRDFPAGDPMVAPLNGDLTAAPPIYIEASKAEYLRPDFEQACIVFEELG